MANGTICYYATPDALQDKINEYFDWCFVYEEKYGRRVPKMVVPPTFSGLARYLGFGSRAALLNYADKENPQYEDIINEAKLRIEEFCETKLMTTKGNPIGMMFVLKNNANWEETTKQQLTGEDNKPLVFMWGVEEGEKEKPIDAIDVEVLEAPKQKVDTEKVAAKTENIKESASSEDDGFDVDIDGMLFE